MPEGPELSLSRDFLRRTIVGRLMVGVCRPSTGRYAKVPPKGFDECFIDKCHVTGVDVKGKFMWWTCSPEMYVFTTYGMSGQWHTSRTKHSALEVTFDDVTLFFNDQRHFGTVSFTNDVNVLKKKVASLGPDMLNDPPTDAAFIARMRKYPTRSLCRVIMDQHNISGVGNYVKAESLYAVSLSPHRKVIDVTDDELIALKVLITNVMQASYAAHGASVRTYTNVDGSRGSMQDAFKVYGKRLDPYGNVVVSEPTDDGRTTWWVPNVQR